MMSDNITILREEEDWYAEEPDHFTKKTWFIDNDTQIKYVRTQKLLVKRPKIKPFGKVAKCTPEENKAFTFLGDEVFIQRPDKDGRFTSEEEDNILKKIQESTQKCRYCGKGHLSYSCPDKHLHRKGEAMSPGGGGGKYIPPSRREGYVDSKVTVKVSNLPEDINRDILKELFMECGHILRCNIPCDRRTGVGRGFGFIDFADKESAEKAVVNMNNYKLNYCVLTVELAENREKKGHKPRISAERIKEIKDEGDKKKMESIFTESKPKYYQPRGMRK